MPMASYDNKGSRQRIVRVPEQIDDWIADLARKNRADNPDSRAGLATEINRILREAYEKSHSRRKA